MGVRAEPSTFISRAQNRPHCGTCVPGSFGTCQRLRMIDPAMASEG